MTIPSAVFAPPGRRSEIAPIGSASISSPLVSWPISPTEVMFAWQSPKNGVIVSARDGDTWISKLWAPEGATATTSGIAGGHNKPFGTIVAWVTPAGGINARRRDRSGERQVTIVGPGAVSTGSQLAMICGTAGSVEVFWVDPTGGVAQASCQPGQDIWMRSVLAPADSAIPTTTLAAATISGSANLTHLPQQASSLWWRGPHSCVRGAYRTVGDPWRLTPSFPAAACPGKPAVALLPTGSEEFTVFYPRDVSTVGVITWKTDIGKVEPINLSGVGPITALSAVDTVGNPPVPALSGAIITAVRAPGSVTAHYRDANGEWRAYQYPGIPKVFETYTPATNNRQVELWTRFEMLDNGGVRWSGAARTTVERAQSLTVTVTLTPTTGKSIKYQRSFVLSSQARESMWLVGFKTPKEDPTGQGMSLAEQYDAYAQGSYDVTCTVE